MLVTMKDLILTGFEKILALESRTTYADALYVELGMSGPSNRPFVGGFQQTRACGWLSSLKIALCRRYTQRLQVTLCLFENTTVLVGRSEGRNSGFSDKLVYNFSALGRMGFDDRTTMYNPVI